MNRRYGERPYYRHSAERDHARAATFTIALTFFVGIMLGCAITLGYMG